MSTDAERGAREAPGRAFAHRCPEADAVVADAVRKIGREIDALRVPRLAGVVLGGGWGRGEGGVFEGGGPGGAPRLSNDLDFYVVTESGASRADERAIAAALAPVGEKWTRILGADAEFCPPKTPARIFKDRRRLMVQELVRGHVDVAGRPGSELFAAVERIPLSELPWIEAVRLMVNRGAGLLFCAGPQGGDPAFVARNIDKAVLGAGDSVLMARGGYVWGAEARSAALGDALYAKALAWKFRPRAEAPCTMEEARRTWLEAADRVMQSPRRGREAARGARHALRWIARRRSLGQVRSFGLDPLLRIMRRMAPLVASGAPFDAALKRDWDVFN